MQHGTKGADLIIVTPWMNTIAQQDNVHLSFQINPHRVSGKTQMSD
jgi:hypothetical protein